MDSEISSVATAVGDIIAVYHQPYSPFQYLYIVFVVRIEINTDSNSLDGTNLVGVDTALSVLSYAFGRFLTLTLCNNPATHI